MPKYKNMLCWVGKETKSEIAKALNKNEVIFAKTIKEFRANISDDSYLVVDVTIAHENIKDFSKMLKDFPNRCDIAIDTEYLADKDDVIMAYIYAEKDYINDLPEDIVKTFKSILSNFAHTCRLCENSSQKIP